VGTVRADPISSLERAPHSKAAHAHSSSGDSYEYSGHHLVKPEQAPEPPTTRYDLTHFPWARDTKAFLASLEKAQEATRRQMKSIEDLHPHRQDKVFTSLHIWNDTQLVAKMRRAVLTQGRFTVGEQAQWT
jgi:hypothetical protein